MFLKSFFKFLGYVCIIISSFLFFLFGYIKYKDKQSHSFLIEENKNRNAFYSNIPYLEIPDYDIKRIIKREATKKFLDDGYVVIWNTEKNLQKIGNLLLAGHNIQNVFKDLKKIKKGTNVYLYDKNDVYIYKVVSKKIIRVTEDAYLEDTPYRQLSLITCTKDNQERLFVICSFIKKKSY